MRIHLRIFGASALVALAVALGGVATAAQARVGGRTDAKPALRHLVISESEGCDFIAAPSSVCMLPFPDDYYTVADPTSPTGRRVNFKSAGMPANVHGEHIEAGPYNASDGFSPGSVVMVRIPGINSIADVKAMHAVPISRLGRYAESDAPVVVIDASTGKRWPIWVEIDSQSTPQEPVLEIHPSVNFASGHRYIVALRNLKNKAKESLEAPEGFRYYRDELPSEQEAVNERRPHFNELFSKLEEAGITRSSLYLAWDFTVASDANNTGRMLAMRNDAFAQLGDDNMEDGIPEGVSPSFEVTNVVDNPNPGEIARKVEGTFQVPCFLFPNCGPGGLMHLNAEGDPIQNGTWTANFDCIIPDSATTGAPETARPALYGHGLLGDASEVYSSPQRSLSQGYDILQCATDEIGMAESDGGVVEEALANVSKFPALPDRLQQGMLDELYLGRILISSTGFSTAPAFHQDGTLATGSVINTSHLFYNGNSQGGIMGGALTAVSPDFTRASLGVPAMNYSVLIPRSVDFAPFQLYFSNSYPNGTGRPLVLDLMQMLWDRGEPDGYAERMTSDPLPDTPAHQVLMNVAFGDHQVTNFQADVEARTIGAFAHKPVLYPHRWGSNILWNVPPLKKKSAFTGSAIFYYDIGPVRESPVGSGTFIGVPPPPLANVPNYAGEDPHGAPRGEPGTEQKLVSDFYEGSIPTSDNCEGGPCYAGGFTGP